MILIDNLERELQVLKDSCSNGKNGEAKHLLQELNELQHKKKNELEDFESLQEEYYQVISNDPGNIKKLEKKYNKVEKASKKLNNYLERIDDIQALLMQRETCETEIVPHLNDLRDQINDIFQKLASAQHRFPDIYKTAERKLNIHLLTPPP